jgi:hypothetical protein
MNWKLGIRRHLWLFVVVLCGSVCAEESPVSSAKAPGKVNLRDASETQSKVLRPDEWRRLDSAIDRALVWLAARQQPDGSFPTLDEGQPAVTSLCVLAFMAHGHVPGEGRYGERLAKATRYIMSCQKENGLVTLNGPEGAELTRDISYELGVTAAYNHGISSLALSEIYGMGQRKEATQLSAGIKRALAATLEMQRWPKDEPHDVGGWRYVVDEEGTEDSDLSITGWNLMFLRSARNAGFEVAQQPIDSAVAYVRRTFERQVGSFRYTIRPATSRSRAMAGAGILALAHAGFHNSTEAKAAALSTISMSTTGTRALRAIGIITACSTRARRCIRWGVPTGTSSSRTRLRRCWRTSGGMARGTRRTSNATGSSATLTRRRWSCWRSVRRTSSCRSFNGELIA